MSPELLMARRQTRPEDDTRAPAPAISWLVDNACAYRRMIEVVRRAQHTLRISQLAIDADCVSYDEDGTPSRLIDELIAAGRRGVEVRIVVNESLLLDTAKPLRRALEELGAVSIEVRGVSCFPRLIHAKLLIADDTDAIIIGSPFVNGYWDDSAHVPTDERRPTRELGGRPLHDLSVHVQGSACASLIAVHEELWANVTRKEAPLAQGAFEQRDGVAIVTTLPAGVSTRHPQGRTDIVNAMLEGLRRAKRFIYLEHQYLSSRRIVAALADVLAREPELQLIVLLNQNPDVTAYRVWQRDRLEEYGLADHPRVGLFSLWTRRTMSQHRLEMSQVFVHSKVMIVDDQWATTGSANLDGVSLHSYGADFKSALGKRVFRHTRNIDVNIVLDGADAPPLATAIRALRCTLWNEHLAGSASRAFDARDRLAVWRATAEQNLASLRAATYVESDDGTIILPFNAEAFPEQQLVSLNVPLGRGIEIAFNPGWLEVHCSPNWIRNMFS